MVERACADGRLLESLAPSLRPARISDKFKPQAPVGQHGFFALQQQGSRRHVGGHNPVGGRLYTKVPIYASILRGFLNFSAQRRASALLRMLYTVAALTL